MVLKSTYNFEETERSYVISAATGKKKINKDLERLHDLLDSKTVLSCHNVLNPSIALSQTRDDDTFKLYLADTGLFTTMIFKIGRKDRRKRLYKIVE